MQSHYCSDASENRNSDENNLQAPILDRGLLYLKSLRQANVRFAVVFFYSFLVFFLFSFLLSFFGFFSLFCLPVQCNLCGMAPGARSFFLNSYFKQVMHIFVIIVIIYLCFEPFSLVVSFKKSFHICFHRQLTLLSFIWKLKKNAICTLLYRLFLHSPKKIVHCFFFFINVTKAYLFYNLQRIV